MRNICAIFFCVCLVAGSILRSLLQRNGVVGFVIVFTSTGRIGMMDVAEENIEFLGRPGRFIHESL